MEKRKLAAIEQYIFDLFHKEGTNKLLTNHIFASAVEYSNADLVRAFEDMEKKGRLLIRYTEEGNDWIHLTPEGMIRAGVSNTEELEQPHVMPHPPKSST
jgi:predicted transcriptional regulator